MSQEGRREGEWLCLGQGDNFYMYVRYDFFIVSQAVRMGSVAPTHYNVVYDSSGLKPDHMQRLTYKLCHMYYNWQVGSALALSTWDFDKVLSPNCGALYGYYRGLFACRPRANMPTSWPSWWVRVSTVNPAPIWMTCCSTSRGRCYH